MLKLKKTFLKIRNGLMLKIDWFKVYDSYKVLEIDWKKGAKEREIKEKSNGTKWSTLYCIILSAKG